MEMVANINIAIVRSLTSSRSSLADYLLSGQEIGHLLGISFALGGASVATFSLRYLESNVRGDFVYLDVYRVRL